MIIEKSIWKHEPLTYTVRQVENGTMSIKEIVLDKTQKDNLETFKEPIKEPIKSIPNDTKTTRKSSELIVDIFGMTWKQKVDKIIKVLEENKVNTKTVNFNRSVVRKENAACPDNFMVCVKLDDGSSIYEANGKFSIKKLLKD